MNNTPPPYMRAWYQSEQQRQRADRERNQAKGEFALWVALILMLATLAQCAIRPVNAELERKLTWMDHAR